MSMQEIAAQTERRPQSPMTRDILSHWKDLAHAKQNTRTDHVMLVLLRAMVNNHPDFQDAVIEAEVLIDSVEDAEFYLASAFTPVTNNVKLRNGRTMFDTVERELDWIASEYRSRDRQTAAVRLGITLTPFGDENLRQLAELVEI